MKSLGNISFEVAKKKNYIHLRQKNTKSKMFKIIGGVRQGGVLSPLLFNIWSLEYFAYFFLIFFYVYFWRYCEVSLFHGLMFFSLLFVWEWLGRLLKHLFLLVGGCISWFCIFFIFSLLLITLDLRCHLVLLYRLWKLWISCNTYFWLYKNNFSVTSIFFKLPKILPFLIKCFFPN